MIESAPCKYYKKRHLKNLTEQEVEEIVAAAKKPGWFRTDIAQKHRVSVNLVNKLCKEAEKQPEKMEARRLREQLDEEKRDSIGEITADILKASKPIVRAQQVQLAVEEQRGIEVSTKLVRRVFRKELQMGYRLAKGVPVQSNIERALVLRQQYSLRLLPLLEKKARVINVDESWLNQTRFLRRTWVPSDAPSTFREKQVSPRISLILALDTEGRIWWSLTQANTDADVMTMFLRHLERRLDQETPGWQETSYILLDNAAWHSSEEMKLRLAKMSLPIIYSGPYSYATAPCEAVFAALKFGDLNPDRLPTGKKSLSHIADMVGKRLKEIPRSLAARYWHKAVLEHFGYLAFERL